MQVCLGFLFCHSRSRTPISMFSMLFWTRTRFSDLTGPAFKSLPSWYITIEDLRLPHRYRKLWNALPKIMIRFLYENYISDLNEFVIYSFFNKLSLFLLFLKYMSLFKQFLKELVKELGPYYNISKLFKGIFLEWSPKISFSVYIWLTSIVKI